MVKLPLSFENENPLHIDILLVKVHSQFESWCCSHLLQWQDFKTKLEQISGCCLILNHNKRDIWNNLKIICELNFGDNIEVIVSFWGYLSLMLGINFLIVIE